MVSRTDDKNGHYKLTITNIRPHLQKYYKIRDKKNPQNRHEAEQILLVCEFMGWDVGPNVNKKLKVTSMPKAKTVTYYSSIPFFDKKEAAEQFAKQRDQRHGLAEDGRGSLCGEEDRAVDRAICQKMSQTIKDMKDEDMANEEEANMSAEQLLERLKLTKYLLKMARKELAKVQEDNKTVKDMYEQQQATLMAMSGQPPAKRTRHAGGFAFGSQNGGATSVSTMEPLSGGSFGSDEPQFVGYADAQGQYHSPVQMVSPSSQGTRRATHQGDRAHRGRGGSQPRAGQQQRRQHPHNRQGGLQPRIWVPNRRQRGIPKPPPAAPAAPAAPAPTSTPAPTNTAATATPVAQAAPAAPAPADTATATPVAPADYGYSCYGDSSCTGCYGDGDSSSCTS